MQVNVEIIDQRAVFDAGGSMLEISRGGPYNISVVLKGVGVTEMNSGPQPVIGVADTLPKPGKYLLELPCPRTRTTASVHIDLYDAHGLHYEDEFVLSFHVHFHKLLKWLIALPVLAMCAVLLVVSRTREGEEYDGKTYHLG